MSGSQGVPPDQGSDVFSSAPLTRTAAGIVGLVAGLLTVAVVITSWPGQHFAGPVPGAIAFGGGRKGGDLVAPVLAVVIGVLVGMAVRAAVESHPAVEQRRGAVVHFLWWACPAFVALGALLAGQPLWRWMAAVTVASSLLMSAELLVSARRRRVLSPAAVSASALGCLLWALAPLAVAVALARTTEGVAELSESVPWGIVAVVAWCLAAATELARTAIGSAGIESTRRWFVALPQCFLPLLVLVIVPVRLRLLDGGVATYPTTAALPVLAWTLAVAGVAACVLDLRRRRAATAARDRDGRLMSPFALLPLVVAVLAGDTRAPVVSADDYHYGETLLGWFRYRAGDLPYVDHQPAHGLVQDDLAAIVSSMFFDGTAASHWEASRLTVAALAALLFAVVLWATASQMLAVLVTVVGFVPVIGAPVEFSGGLTWIVLLTAGWLLVAPRLRASPRQWLIVWIVLTPLLVLAAPAQGLVFAVAAGVLALRSVDQVRRDRGVKGLTIPAAVAGALVLVAVVTPLGRMLGGAVAYVFGNAGINAAAYGIPWNAAVTGTNSQGFAFFDGLRMVWLVGLVLCSVVALAELRARRWRGEVLALAVFFALFLGGVLPYVMGRVDPVGPARAGYATIFTLALLVPAMVWWRLRPQARAVLALGVVMVATALFGAGARVDLVVTAAEPYVDAGALVDGSSLDLPGYGVAAPRDTGTLEQAGRLAQILDAELEPGAPYYDATSRNAQYFYVGRRPVVSVTAVYNSPLPADQRRTIRQLEEAEPEIAVLSQPGGNIVHDGGGVALRTPLLARYLERTYTPYLQDGFVLGRREGKPPAAADDELTLSLDADSDAVWDRGVARTSPALKLADPQAAAMIPAGAHVALPDGSRAKVASIEGDVVHLTDAIPAAALLPEARIVTVDVADLDRQLHRLWLFERAFGQTELHRLPASWGRSLEELDGMERVTDLEVDGAIHAGGPELAIPLPDGFGPREVDMVAFDTKCDGSDDPLLNITWSSRGLSSQRLPGRNFQGVDGPHLVPLDSSAFWRGADEVDQLVVKALDGADCTSVEFSDVSLWKRVD